MMNGAEKGFTIAAIIGALICGGIQLSLKFERDVKAAKHDMAYRAFLKSTISQDRVAPEKPTPHGLPENSTEAQTTMTGGSHEILDGEGREGIAENGSRTQREES